MRINIAFLYIFLILSIVLCSIQKTAFADGGKFFTKLYPILNNPKKPNSLWSVYAIDKKTNKVLYSQNPDQPVLVASALKLITTAAALDQLGKNFTFETKLLIPKGKKVLNGDLVLVGGGDPGFASKLGNGGKGIFKKWATNLKKSGVNTINGNIIGDDNIFLDEPYSPGWSWEDQNTAFSAQVSGLTANLGTFSYRIPKHKKNRGKKTTLYIVPKTDYLEIQPIVSKKISRFGLHRLQGSNKVQLKIPANAKKNTWNSRKNNSRKPNTLRRHITKRSITKSKDKNNRKST